MTFKNRLDKLITPAIGGEGYTYPDYNAILSFLNKTYKGTFEDIDTELLIIRRSSKEITTPLDISSKILSKITYTVDDLISPDFIQATDITLFSQRGDCDDFARAASMFLDVNKSKLRIIKAGQAVLFAPEAAHAVAWGLSYDKKYYIFDTHNVYITDNLTDGLYYSFFRVGHTNDVVIYVYEVNSFNSIDSRVQALGEESLRVLYPSEVPKIDKLYYFGNNDFLNLPINEKVIAGILIALLAILLAIH